MPRTFDRHYHTFISIGRNATRRSKQIDIYGSKVCYSELWISNTGKFGRYTYNNCINPFLNNVMIGFYRSFYFSRSFC